MCACVCVDLCVRACVCLCVLVCARVDLCVRVMTIDADGNSCCGLPTHPGPMMLPACLPACLPRGATDDTRAGSADGPADGSTDVGADSAAASRSVGLGLPHERFTRHGSVGSVDCVAQGTQSVRWLSTHVLSQCGA